MESLKRLYVTDSLITLSYYIDDGGYNMSSDCGDLLLSFIQSKRICLVLNYF